MTEEQIQRRNRAILGELHKANCAICKAEFYPTSLWRYKGPNKELFCSWKCLRENERRREEKRKNAKRGLKKQA